MSFWKPYETCCIYSHLGLYSTGQNSGMCIRALIKSAHVPVQHPGHISTACSALLCHWNMKYAWTIKSIWTIHLNIRYTRPSKKIIKCNTHRLHSHTCVHTKWHINMHSHVVHNGLSVSVPTFCWQCTRSNRHRRAHTQTQMLKHTLRRGKRFDICVHLLTSNF